jgi:hypothetical protein
MFYINSNPNKTLLETFYKKNSDFCTKKKPIKPKKPRFEVGFLGGFFGFYWAGFLLPTLQRIGIEITFFCFRTAGTVPVQVLTFG